MCIRDSDEGALLATLQAVADLEAERDRGPLEVEVGDVDAPVSYTHLTLPTSDLV